MKSVVLLLAVLLAAPAAARPVVVELFTSEACSSCPPAEALLRHLQAADPDILPLSFHVTYWNGPAWTDRYAFQAATDRQSWYAGLAHDDLYTPEAVVDGTTRLVGSNTAALTAAIAAARADSAAPSLIVRDGATVTVLISAAPAGPPVGGAEVWLVGYDPSHTTHIGGGENGGATITEVNVVRGLAAIGGFAGTPETLRARRPTGMRLAVLVQRPNGQILAAAP